MLPRASHTRWLTAALACGLLCAAQSAQATTYYVNKSAPSPSDGGPCTDPGAPCLTIQAAVNKAQATSGNTVQVLPDPNGFTDTYAEGVVVTGQGNANPIVLQGAGAGNGGTLIAAGATPNVGLDVENASTVRDFHVTGGKLWGLLGNGSTLERLVVESPDAEAALRATSSTVRDTTLSGSTAAEILSSRLVRCVLDATAVGIGPVNPGSPQRAMGGSVLDSVIRGPTGAGTVGLSFPPSGLVPLQTVQFRHVTMMGFDIRVRIDKGGSAAGSKLEAVNSTLAGPDGTKDLELGGDAATASLINVNRSASRTTVGTGATLEDLAPLDVAPQLTTDGHLQPGSPLIDRGTTAGFLAGSPDDTGDIDGQARVQGAAPDVGADEIRGPGGPGGPGGGGPTLGRDITKPVFQTASVTNSTFKIGSQSTPLTGVAARKVPTGTTFRFLLSEAAQATITIQRASKGKRNGRRCVKSTPKLRRAKGCTRYVTVGTLRRIAHQGLNSVAFSGRIGRKALAPAKYLAALVAVDASNNRSLARTVSFKVVRS